MGHSDRNRWLLANNAEAAGVTSMSREEGWIVVRFGATMTRSMAMRLLGDGDGDDTVGVYNPGTSTFYLDNAREDTLPNIEFQFGNRGSLPVAGDWDGDGRDGVGVYEPRSATFRLKNTLSPGAANATFRFGPRRGGWLPIAGAW